MRVQAICVVRFLVERLVAIVFLIAKSVYRKKPNAYGEKRISIIIADVVRQID